MKIQMQLLSLLIVFLLFACVSAPLTEFDVRRANEPVFNYSLLREGNINLFDKLKENSGLTLLYEVKDYTSSRSMVVTHNDSFNSNHLFILDYNGSGDQLLTVAGKHREVPMGAKATNFDWEAIATLGEGRVVVADCGNNWHFRRAMPLYFVDLRYFGLDGSTDHFNFLTRLPGSPIEQKNDDVEAMFCRKEALYFFTKEAGGTRMNRLELPDMAKRFSFRDKWKNPMVPSRLAKIYPMEFCGTLQTQGNEWQSLVTSADYHKESKQMLLLTYGGIEIYQENENASEKPLVEATDFFHIGTISLAEGQWEAACFLNSKEILVSNEQGVYQIYGIEHE